VGPALVICPARGLEDRALIRYLAVLTGDVGGDPKRVGAEAGGVFYKALVAAVEAEGKLGDGGIGDMGTNPTIPRAWMTHVATSHLCVLGLALGTTKTCALRP
jgi:hypothetical protein